jgi:hypothetical protein
MFFEDRQNYRSYAHPIVGPSDGKTLHGIEIAVTGTPGDVIAGEYPGTRIVRDDTFCGRFCGRIVNCRRRPSPVLIELNRFRD